MLDTETILAAIGSTEETTFGEFCSALGSEMPDDRDGWRELFSLLRDLEKDGSVEVSRTGNKIDSMILTESGANRIREKMDSSRGLLSMM